MNVLHAHLLINHLPVVGIPLALVFWFFSVSRKDGVMEIFTLRVLALLALTIVPVFFTGDGAEDLAEELLPNVESWLESHEDLGAVSLWASLALAGVSLLASLPSARRRFPLVALRGGVLIAAIMACLSLALTANTGGQIRRPDLRSPTTSAVDAEPNTPELNKEK